MNIKKPILFNTEMVKAILDDRKNQTRRIVANKILNEIHKNDCYIQNGQIYGTCMCQGDPDGSGGYEVDRWEEIYTQSYSQYKVGDILYVREKSYFVDCDCQCPWQCSPQGWYATDEVSYSGIRCSVETIPSIHMRKEHARIFLKVTNVRVERLQDIKYSDIEKEGVGFNDFLVREGVSINIQLQRNWINLWNSTAKDGYRWEDNPYVFVYEFKRIEK